MKSKSPPSDAPYVALDLEFNQPSQRIIQVGAVIGRVATGQVLNRFSVYVNPDEPLSPKIADLCGIAPGVLEIAGDLAEAYEHLENWLAPYAGERRLNPLTWGGADAHMLLEALGYNDGSTGLFGRRWVDVKTVYTAWQDAQGLPATGGLASSMKRLGLAFQGRQHDAADDALNTFRMYARLIQAVQAGTRPATQ
jgi:inhibitor of KinA sporulation pathway (predicted exonuclease)